MLALIAEDQSTGLRHLSGIIFDDICSYQRLADFACGNFPLEHTLNRVDSKEYLKFIHKNIIHLPWRCRSLRQRTTYNYLRDPSLRSGNHDCVCSWLLNPAILRPKIASKEIELGDEYR
jgi:hypothetical protein